MAGLNQVERDESVALEEQLQVEASLQRERLRAQQDGRRQRRMTKHQVASNRHDEKIKLFIAMHGIKKLCQGMVKVTQSNIKENAGLNSALKALQLEQADLKAKLNNNKARATYFAEQAAKASEQAAKASEQAAKAKA